MGEKFPCCSYPVKKSNFYKDACPGCDFIKKYMDERGWVFFVRSGIGENCYKAFYRKPGSKKEKGCSMVAWQPTFTAAQIDLDQLAKKKNWQEVN